MAGNDSDLKWSGQQFLVSESKKPSGIQECLFKASGMLSLAVSTVQRRKKRVKETET